jgi:hypothetical protein
MSEPTDPMPVFVIKAKDALALATIERYRRLCLQRGLDVQAVEVEKAAVEIAEWQQRHSSLVQLPDHQHVPVTP